MKMKKVRIIALFFTLAIMVSLIPSAVATYNDGLGDIQPYSVDSVKARLIVGAPN